MTSEREREAAKRALRYDKGVVAPMSFDAGWNARGQHDKEQIAAMAEMLEVAASLIRALAGQSEEATE